MPMLAICTFTALTSILFALMPALAVTLIKSSRKRFNDWFEAGTRAFAARDTADTWTREVSRAWQEEVPRLAKEGALNAGQITQAHNLLADLLEGNVTYSHKSLTLVGHLGAKAIICAAAGALTSQAVITTTSGGFPAAVCCIISALSLCLALTDIAARIIPNALVAALCGTGVLLRVAIGQLGDLVALFAIASLAIGAACGINALHARRHKQTEAIGGGDIKSLLAIVLCSGATGLFPACLVMLASILTHAAIHRFALGQVGKLPLGPSIAIALIVGALTSAH